MKLKKYEVFYTRFVTINNNDLKINGSWVVKADSFSSAREKVYNRFKDKIKVNEVREIK